MSEPNLQVSSVQVDASSLPTVPVSNLTSVDNVIWSSEEHHVGIVHSSKEGHSFHGSFLDFPGFKDLIAPYPMVRMVRVEVQYTPRGVGSFLAALSVTGQALTKALARGKKQRVVFGGNNFNMWVPQRGVFSFGDGLAKQIKPVSSTAASSEMIIEVIGAHEVVIDLYFQTSGPMDKVYDWGWEEPTSVSSKTKSEMSIEDD